jgi:hypothetical protein
MGYRNGRTPQEYPNPVEHGFEFLIFIPLKIGTGIRIPELYEFRRAKFVPDPPIYCHV